MGKTRSVRQLRRTLSVLNTLSVLSVFRGNRWTRSALLFWFLASNFLYGLQWLVYLGGERGWLTHPQRWYYYAVLLQIAGTLIVYPLLFVQGPLVSCWRVY